MTIGHDKSTNYYQTGVTQSHPDYNKLKDKLHRFEQDIQTMNDILNYEAEAADLCESYERALDEVNSAVSSFHLTGRKRDWHATISVTVQVQATTEDDADEAAREIERSILNNGDNTYMIVGADYDSNTISLAY